MKPDDQVAGLGVAISGRKINVEIAILFEDRREDSAVGTVVARKVDDPPREGFVQLVEIAIVGVRRFGGGKRHDGREHENRLAHRNFPVRSGRP